MQELKGRDILSPIDLEKFFSTLVVRSVNHFDVWEGRTKDPLYRLREDI